VAGQTAGILKRETDKFGAALQNCLLMASIAWHRQVAPGKRVITFLMLFDRVFRRRETLDRMTFLAGPLSWPRRELAVMVIAMAIQALFEFHALE
jgi:hypothetical protein